MQKPIQRSKLRLFFGRLYYRLRRRVYWHLSRVKFAKKYSEDKKEVMVFEHQSLLRRPLKDVDMWMQENKIKNLELAIKNLNGLIIKPGETFSYWRQIGHPTKKKGYVDGMVLYNGQVKSGIGGGLCQLSNLIYWMTLHTPLTLIERWRHSYDVFPDVKRKQPFGSGATCAYPNIDLQIKNNTSQAFQLCLELSPTHLKGSWRSDKTIPHRYEVFEKSHEIKMEWWGQYTRNNVIARKILPHKNNATVKEEFITENHAIMMYDPFLEAEKI